MVKIADENDILQLHDAVSNEPLWVQLPMSKNAIKMAIEHVIGCSNYICIQSQWRTCELKVIDLYEDIEVLNDWLNKLKSLDPIVQKNIFETLVHKHNTIKSFEELRNTWLMTDFPEWFI